MADEVQRTMEDMVPELEDLSKRGLFSQDEIKSIVKKRRSLEYSLRRKQVLRSHYQRYIQYEIRLDLLRRKRKNRQGAKKKSVSDYAGTRRVHALYNRALRRFKNDVSAWGQYIHFCKLSGSKRYLGRVYASAVQLNPTSVSLWIDAAAWEYEENQNVINARALLQQAIRLNKSQLLWREYLRLELLYTQQIRERHLILGVAEAEAKAPFLQGAVVKVVIKNAIQAFPDDFRFRMTLIEVVREFKGMDTLLGHLYSSLEDFPSHEESYGALARWHLIVADNDAGERCDGVLEAAVEKIPSPAMWELYVRILQERLNSSECHDNSQGCSTVQKLLHVFSRAEASRAMSPVMYLTWADVLQQHLATPDGGIAVLRRGLSSFPTSPVLRTRLLCAHAIDDHQGEDNPLQKLAILNCFKRCVSDALPENMATLTRSLFHIMLASSFNIQGICDKEFEAALASVKGDGLCVAEEYFRYAATCMEKSTVRQLYTGLLGRPDLPDQLFLDCIHFEKMHNDSSTKQNVAHLFEQALQTHGDHSHQLWLAFMDHQQVVGSLKDVSTIYLQAYKALGDSVLNLPQ